MNSTNSEQNVVPLLFDNLQLDSPPYCTWKNLHMGYHQRYNVRDDGEFVNDIFKEISSTTSGIYGRLIGRSSCRSHVKSTFTANDIALQGDFFKRGTWFKSWKKRYFILRKDIQSLCYYSSKESLELLGSILLTSDNFVVKDISQRDADGFPFAISICSAEAKETVVRFDSLDVMLTWKTEIMNVSVNVDALNSARLAKVPIPSSVPSPITSKELWDAVFENAPLPSAQSPVSRQKGSYSTSSQIESKPRSSTQNADQRSSRRPESATTDMIDEIKRLGLHENIPGVFLPVRGHSHDHYSGTTSSRSVSQSYAKSTDDDKPTHDAHKSKKYGKCVHLIPPPVEPNIDAYVINDDSLSMLNGLQLSLRLQNVCSLGDSIMVVLWLLNSHQASSSTQSTDGQTKTAAKPIPFSKTEIHKVRSSTDASTVEGGFVQEVYVHFKLLLRAPPPSCRAVTVVLYRVERRGGQSEDMGVPPHEVLAQCLIKTKSFDSSEITKYKMDPTPDILMDLIPFEPNSVATLGVRRLKSSVLNRHRLVSRRILELTPYAEACYALQTTKGPSLALEQLYASKNSISVASALLSLTRNERIPVLRQLVDVISALVDDVQSQFSDRASTVGTDNPGMRESMAQHFDHLRGANSRRDFLTKLLAECVEFSNTYHRETGEALELYDVAMKGDPEGFLGAVIGNSVGGAVLRRSTQKTDPRWQYCATNLNVHMILIKDPNEKGSTESASSSVSESLWVHYVPFITLGVPAAHGLKFHDGGLRRIFSECPDAQQRLRWMHILQCSHLLSPHISRLGRSVDVDEHFVDQSIEDMFDQCPKEAQSIFGAHATLDTPEGLYGIMKKKNELGVRLDICTSQILGLALTFVQTICSLAALEGGSYALVLARSLKIGFLINLQSMLSTAGNELGMIEDLDCTTLWLTLVRVRIVARGTKSSANASSGAGDFIVDPSDVKIRRDKLGRVIVDLCVNEEVAIAVRSALNSMLDYEAPPQQSQSDGIFGANPAEISFDEDEGSPSLEVLATTELYGVAFTQGVNEMQFVVNTFAREARHQASINVESLQRLKTYFFKYRHALKYQLLKIEMGQVYGNASILPNEDIDLKSPELSSNRAIKVISKILDESDK